MNNGDILVETVVDNNGNILEGTVVDNSEFYEFVDVLETELSSRQVEVNVNEEATELKDNKPSWLTQIKTNFTKGFVSGPVLIPCASRLQKLAGISPTPVARLVLKNVGEITLNDYPTLFEILRYKICGIKYEVLKEKK